MHSATYTSSESNMVFWSGVERDDAKFWHAPIALAPPPSLSTPPPTRSGRPSTRLPDPPSTATRTFVPHAPSATLGACARKARRGAIADPCRPRRYRPRGAGGRDARETLPDGSSRLRRRAVPRRETLVVRYEERMKHREFYENTSRRRHKFT